MLYNYITMRGAKNINISKYKYIKTKHYVLFKIFVRKTLASMIIKKLIRQDLGGSGPGLTQFIF